MPMSSAGFRLSGEGSRLADGRGEAQVGAHIVAAVQIVALASKLAVGQRARWICRRACTGVEEASLGPEQRCLVRPGCSLARCGACWERRASLGEEVVVVVVVVILGKQDGRRGRMGWGWDEM